MNLSDRIALFKDGRIEQLGTPEQLYEQPETLFTARFFGDPNVFELPDAAGLAGAGLADASSEAARETVGWEDNAWVVDSRTVSERVRAGGRVALVVRPEDVSVADTADAVPPGANAVPATIRDVEYMGAYRTAVLSLGRSGLTGRARLDARTTDLGLGRSVVAWWRVDRQRLVAG